MVELGKEPGTLVVFLHMPKCGGKSLERLLLKNYGIQNVIRIYRPSGQPIDGVLAKIPKEKTVSATLMYGYIPFGTGEKIGRNCVYFTILRDSVSRVLSFYRYVKYDFVQHPLHRLLKNGSVTIRDLCTASRFHNTRNVMTKLLAGYETREKETTSMLQQGKSNLDAMPAFGLLEYYRESINRLAEEFGWAYRDLERVNVSSVREVSVKESLKEYIPLIREANHMDEELYHYAKEKFLALRGLH